MPVDSDLLYKFAYNDTTDVSINIARDSLQRKKVLTKN